VIGGDVGDAELRQELLELVLQVSFRRQKVTLASGAESDFYLDLRQTLMRPRGLALAGALMFEKLRSGPPVQSVGGMAVGAVPLIAAILAAAETRDPGTALVGFFVRKETKRHGLAKRIEGAFEPGQTVALVEDTVTTGGSTLEAMTLAEEAGAKVARVLCIVDRGEGAAAAFAARGIALEALFERSDLPV
jgi:orotate phosphoribosyltransferase